MILHNMVIGKDDEIIVKKRGRKLSVRTLFPDKLYGVDSKFRKASARWKNKLTINHKKTKAM